MRKVPEWFREFAEGNPQITEAYENLAAECRKFGPLSEKEQLLVKLGVATGSHTEGSVRSQVRKALDAGVKPAEIRHAIVLALAPIGFPRMMAALDWAEDVLKAKIPENKKRRS
jgi:alkylhydroperoxidase/carboxymuconolactone decarboxylase family protein YurZ